MINVKPATVSLAIGEGVARNTIFSWPFMQKIKASIMTDNNALVSGLLGEKFRMYTMVPQISKKAHKTSEGLPVSLPLSIQGKQENMKDIISRNSRVELNKTAIH